MGTAITASSPASIGAFSAIVESMKPTGCSAIFPIFPKTEVANHKKGSITCRTCQLKKCIGRCRFEVTQR
jgi:hypothetical protein